MPRSTSSRAARRPRRCRSRSSSASRESFAEEHVALDGSGAQALIDAGVRLVGIDYLTLGDEDAHHALLGAGVVAIEGLDLRGVEPGEYRLVCAPLKLVGSDGAPARALLLDQKEDE